MYSKRLLGSKFDFIAELVLVGALAITVTNVAFADDASARDSARRYMAEQKYDQAIAGFDALLLTNPLDSAAIKIDLGICFKAKKDYPKALNLFAGLAASQDKAVKTRAMFLTEDCYCEQGKIADAVTVLTKAYNECPDAIADVLLRRAGRLADLGRYKESLADYNEFSAKFSDQKDRINEFKGRLPELRLRAAGIFDGPTSALESALAAANDEMDAKAINSRLADCYMREQKWADAIPHWNIMLSSSPEQAASIKMNLANCYKKTLDFAKALALFDEVSQQSPAMRNGALMGIDECLLAQGKIRESAEFMAKVAAETSDLAPAALLRSASRKYDLTQYADALAVFEKCLANYEYDAQQTDMIKKRINELRLHVAKLFEGSSDAIKTEFNRAAEAKEDASYLKLVKTRLGESLLKERKFEEAKTLLDSLLVESPEDSINIKMSLGMANRGLKKFDEAIAIYREIAATPNPRQNDAIFCTSYALIEQGKRTDSVAYLKSLDKLMADCSGAVVLGRAAQFTDYLSEFENAKADLNRIIAEHPTSNEALHAYVVLAEIQAFRDRKTGDARNTINQMMSKFPHYTNLIRPVRCLAVCEYLEGNYAKAVTLYEKAMTYPDDGNWYPYLLFMIGDCYKFTGQEAKSRASFEKLIATYPKDHWAALAQKRIAVSNEVTK